MFFRNVFVAANLYVPKHTGRIHVNFEYFECVVLSCR